MDSNFSGIIGFLEPLRVRMYLNKLIVWLQRGVIAGGIICIFLSLLALVLPFTFDLIAVCQIFFISIALVIPLAIMVLPDEQVLVRAADNFGLKERLISAVELKGRYDPVSVIQRQEAKEALRGIEFRKLCPINVNIRIIAIVFILYTISAGLTFIETESRVRANELEKFRKEELIKTRTVKEMKNN
jgi:hypothetical protein